MTTDKPWAKNSGDGIHDPEQDKVRYDFTGSISGFDFPPETLQNIPIGTQHKNFDPNPPVPGFNPSIFASQSHFAGAPRPRAHPEDPDDDREEMNIRRRERDE
jgi:hypothetical protein